LAWKRFNTTGAAPGDTGVLLLDDGEEVPVARRKRPELRRLLGL
jgi:DNA-binding LytR/AlgR family response regulator